MWVTTTALDTYGAQPGAVGSSTDFTVTPPGILPGFQCALLPVTLAHVDLRPEAGAVHAIWATASEVDSVAFRWFADAAASQALQADFTASLRGNAAEPTAYSAHIAASGSGAYWLAEFDRYGNREMHGPYQVLQPVGHDPAAQAIDWGAIKTANRGAEQRYRSAAMSGASAARVWIEQVGFQRVSYQDLLGAGVDLTGVPFAEIAVFHGDQAVARRIVGADAVFGPGAAIEFFAAPRDSLYGAAAAYRIERSDAGAVAIAEDNSPAGPSRPSWSWADSRYAAQNAYNFAAPIADPWYADRLLAFAGTPASRSLALDWSARALVNQPASVQAEMEGVTDWPGSGLDHQVQLAVAGVTRDQQEADGVSLIALAATAALGSEDGSLDVQVNVTGATGFDFDVVNLESVTLHYPRLAVAADGRWYGQSVQFGAVANDPSIEPPPAAVAGLLADGFESTSVVKAGESLRVQNLSGQQVVAYASSNGVWRHLNDVRVQSSGGGFDGFLPSIKAGDDVFVASSSALPTPRVEAIPADVDIRSGQAQYLVISHPLFANDLGDLMGRRMSQGLSTAVVDVTQIYQQFGNGEPDPDAIRAYLRFAAAARGTRYVLLVGGDTYDYHDYLQIGSQSFIPTLYRQTSDVVHFAPLDSVFGDLDDDGVPDIAVGRLPVRSAAELALVIGKILAAEAPVSGRSAVLASGASDSGNSFPGLSETFAAELPGTWTFTRADVDSLGVAGARNVLLQGWASNPDLVGFVGHSAPGQWTFDPLITVNDLATLAGTTAVPAVLQWGCWNTYFVSPNANSLGQALLLQGTQGSAAVFGSASLTDIANHSALASEFYSGLSSGVRLGDALLQARKTLAAAGRRAIETQAGGNLLGDPAMILR